LKNKIIITLFLLFTPVFYAVYYSTYDMWNHENYENRMFVTAEDIKQADFTQKTATVDSFVNDTVPFKNELTALNSAINLKAFGTVQNDKVLLGKDNWLFHKNADDSKSIDDYQGLGHYTEEELRAITDKLIYLDSVLASKGIEYKFIIPPNKEQVYSRYMPQNIPVFDISKTQQLADYVNANSDVCLVYPKEYFKELSESEHIYYKYDTHWNNLGALRGLQLIMDGFEDAAYTQTDTAPLMDLANVSSLYPYIEPDEYYEISTDKKETGKQICLLHDSFGDMMIPVLEQKYTVQDCKYAYFNEFYLSRDTNIFIMEINERYLYRLFTTIDTIISHAEAL